MTTLVALLLAPGIRWTLPRLGDAAGAAMRVHRLDADARRAALLGDWYSSVQGLRRTVPENAAVDIVMLTPAARDIAVLAGTALFPRDCRFFDGWDAWQRRSPAIFIHDARAVNAPAGAKPPRGDVLLTADPQRRPPLRLER